MKTIIDNTTNVSKFILPDETTVVIKDKSISFDDLIVTDLNSSNVTILYNVNPPSDWEENKYFCVNGSFVLNLNWQEIPLTNKIHFTTTTTTVAPETTTTTTVAPETTTTTVAQ